MKHRNIAAVSAILAATMACTTAEAKTLEDILKEKGVITEADYKEVTKSKAFDYKVGNGFTLTSPDEKFQLTLGGRLQTRYTFTDLEENSASKPDSSKWEAKRIKFWLKGYAFTKDLTYLYQVDFANSGSSKMLEHAYLNYRLIDEVQLLAGQTKVPFGRQWLNSSGSQQFVDRSMASDMFRPGYDVGAKLHGDIMKGLATYEFGIYGGAGQSTVRSSNDNAIAARATINPFGKMAYSESDLDTSPKPLLSIGANYYRNTLNKTATTTLETNAITLAGSSGWLGKGLSTFATSEKIDVNAWGVDAAFKWLGASAQAEYLIGQADGQTSNKTLRAHGFYAQAGYCIIPKTVEVAFRYSYVDPNRDTANDLITDTQGAVSYYFSKHNLKLQADVTNTHDQRTKTDDKQYRLQAQIIF
ncbi:phosphate-selective porin O and P [Geobacter metallireducens RCH3]|uniref:Phosphate-selective outer membrane channel n=1 Tax=Geobacter metallireducens (strain ATCC 53774 / DSM 7210 / GS-15) TaxID=269799 RepID=Q39WU2_GEOMG|nr:porin [Geobacter metallireducens]ABB31282.1 phosphate-selective outer membrane channel [Geobacter metallireducens GS-15]EHP86529.1 phosphate-selective porin O and P [Geobacter metallireducens RCH3]